MNSKSFSTQIRPAGQEFRSGVIGEVISDIHHDVDVAFKSLETATGYGWAPCRVAYDTAEDTTFAGGGKDAVDGVIMDVGDRILVTGQHTAKNNGIYVVTALGAGVDDATWERANDLNATSEVALGYKVRVLYGSAHALTDWVVTASPAVLGTNTLTFTKMASVGSDILLRTEYNAQTVLAATADNTPLALTIAEQRILGRVTGGNIAALTPTQVRSIAIATSEAEVDQLIASGTVDGDRLKANGLDSTNFNAAVADTAILPRKLAAKSHVALPDADSVPTAAQLVGGLLSKPASVARSFTLPAAADIIANTSVGTTTGAWFEFTLVNSGVGTIGVSVPPAAGITYVGSEASKTVDSSTSATFLVLVTGAATVSVFRK